MCLSVFFLADATDPLGIPGPAGAGLRQSMISDGAKTTRVGIKNSMHHPRSAQLSLSQSVALFSRLYP